MARVANANSTSYGSVNQSAHTQQVTLSFYVSTNTLGDDEYRGDTYWGYSANPSTNGTYHFNDPALGTTWGGRSINVTADTTWYWRVRGLFYDYAKSPSLQETKYDGGTIARLSWAIDPTVGTPSLSNETSSTVDVDFSWTPATNETAVDATVQYKLTSEPTTWIDWTSASDSDQTGYTSRSSSGDFATTTITGLSADTSYDFRIKVDRTGTANSTTVYYGTQASTSTIADTPSVTTDAASSLGATSATLNATVDHNTVDGNLSWRYIDTASYSAPPDDAQGTEVSYASNPITGDGSGAKGITGLSFSTSYTFWAIYDPTGAEDTVFGDAVAFTTDGDPSDEAKDEEHTVFITETGQWNTPKTITFPLYSVRDNSADLFVTDANPFGSASIHIFKDGTYYQEGNTPTQVSSGKGLYTITTDADEMQAGVTVTIIITDGGTSFRDVHIRILIQSLIGNIDVAASTNTSAVKLSGSGTEHGLEAIAGSTGYGIKGKVASLISHEDTIASTADSTHVTLGSGASEVRDTYNGGIIVLYEGDGSRQSRIIIDYIGAVPTDAQDETSYDNSPASEGTFTAGSGYAGSDTITLSDGTVITVDAVGGSGEVTEFTVDSSASTGAQSGDTLTESSTDGGGSGFELLPEADNLTANKKATLHKAISDYATTPPDSSTKYLILGGDQMWSPSEDTTLGVSPGAEPTSVPVYTDYYAEMLQYIFEKMAYKHTETATVHQMFEQDASDAKFQYGVDDDGSTETKNRTEDV